MFKMPLQTVKLFDFNAILAGFQWNQLLKLSINKFRANRAERVLIYYQNLTFDQFAINNFI